MIEILQQISTAADVWFVYKG